MPPKPPPKKRGRPPKDKTDNPPPAKKQKQQTSFPVIDPNPIQNAAVAPVNPDKPGTSKESSSSKKRKTTTKLPLSHVHKEFVQEFSKDSNGNKTWTSKCKHCPPGEGEYKDKQASHLKKHLENNHTDLFQMVEEKDEKDRVVLENRVKVKDKQGRCLNRYLDLFANTGMPLSMADNPHLKALLKEMDGDIKFPGRTGTTSMLVKGKFGSMVNKMLALMKRARVIHATTDCWSNAHCRSSFIGFTGHCYDPLTKSRKSFRMALREFKESHTAVNIIKKSVGIFKELDIKHKVCYFVVSNYLVFEV